MRNIRDDVDAFFAGEIRHILPVPGTWQDGNRNGEFRMRLPIEVDGEVGAFQLDLISAPDSQNPGIRFILLCGRAIFRLCLHNEMHTNSFNKPADLGLTVEGPHYHSWNDNRRFGPANGLPKELRNARKLPLNQPDTDSAFKWFLNETKIIEPKWPMPSWPTRTLLL